MPEGTIQKNSNQHTTLHGVLLDVRAVGVLIIGKSGTGKSDTSLELIARGSKLISDDIVETKRSDTNKIVGQAPEGIKDLMEIRGLGIINIRDLYGPESLLNESAIDIVIELSRWDASNEYDRLGIDERSYKILGIDIPYYHIPVAPGRNTALIVEVAALNHLLKSSDYKLKEKIMSQLENIKSAAGIK